MPPPNASRYKVKCKVFNCPKPVFDNDYRLKHNKLYHGDYIKKNKGIPYERLGAQSSPFEMSCAKKRKTKEGVGIQREEEASGDDVGEDREDRFREEGVGIQREEEASGDDVGEDREDTFQTEVWLKSVGQFSHMCSLLEDCRKLLNNVKNADIVMVEQIVVEINEMSSQIKSAADVIIETSNEALVELRAKKTSVEAKDVRATLLPHDPGQRPKTKTDKDRRYLIQIGPHQPKLNRFPTNIDIQQGKQRTFSSRWYAEYPHLEYSITEDAAFCHVCSLFPYGPGRENCEEAWVTTGVRQWHKMKSRGKDKLGKLPEHFSSKAHRAALHDMANFCHESQHVDTLLDKRKRAARIQEEEDAQFNKTAVSVLLDVAKTLGRQGLAFRGDGDEENGNFRQIVYLLSRHNSVLARWLSDQHLRPYHVTYLSAQTQNEFIHLLGKTVQNQIAKEVSDSGMFSVIADTTPDVSNTDRLAVAVRYVNVEGCAKERLIEVKEVSDKTGEGLCHAILGSIQNAEIDPNCLAFQSYDYANVMCGSNKGVQAKMSKELGRQVPYVPCQAHRVNIFVEHISEESKLVSKMFDTLESLYVFFSSSSKRQEILTPKLEVVENALKLRNLSKTRWTARAESVQAVWISLGEIIECLAEIAHHDSKFDKNARTQSAALLKNIENPDFIVTVMFMKNIMLKTKLLTDELQKTELNILNAKVVLEATVSSLESIRNSNDDMTNQIRAALAVCENFDIDANKYFEVTHRRRQPPKRIDDRPELACNLGISSHFRKEFYSCLLYTSPSPRDGLLSRMPSSA